MWDRKQVCTNPSCGKSYGYDSNADKLDRKSMKVCPCCGEAVKDEPFEYDGDSFGTVRV
jgi:hypothetical protein